MWRADSARRRVIARTIPIAVLAMGVALTLFAQKAGKSPSIASLQKDGIPALFQPAVAEWQFLESSTSPPTESACYAAGVPCFTPFAMQNAYNISPLYSQGFTGRKDDSGNRLVRQRHHRERSPCFQQCIWPAASLRGSGSELCAGYADIHHPGDPGIATAQPTTT